MASFLYALARRGNMSIGSGINPMTVALPRPDQREKVKKRWPDACVVESALDLETWLRQNIK
jgi:hypothetical protein